jgi:BRCT domain type II-containing protein
MGRAEARVRVDAQPQEQMKTSTCSLPLLATTRSCVPSDVSSAAIASQAPSAAGSTVRFGQLNPGRLAPGAPLVQGMKVAFTGDTRTAREELIARSVAAGLNVMSSVSRHTSVLVTDESDSDSAKCRAARSADVPVITEEAFLGLLTGVRPGTGHANPAAPASPLPAQRRTGQPASAAPLSGRRILVLGGPHDHASAQRARIAGLGGAAAVNLSAGVTDVVLLADGAGDRRMPHITARQLPIHDADWLATLAQPSGTAAEVTAEPAGALVLPRGGVLDLPPAHDGAGAWTVTASWGHRSRRGRTSLLRRGLRLLRSTPNTRRDRAPDHRRPQRTSRHRGPDHPSRRGP